MKISRGFLLSAILISAACTGGHAEEKGEHALNVPPIEFFVGSYQIVGTEPGTGRPYAGTALISEDRGKLKVVRTINGKSVACEATLTTVVEDIPALRMEFSLAGKKVVGTFQIHSDWNNYARLTGYLEPQGVAGKKPGRETFFFNEGD